MNDRHQIITLPHPSLHRKSVKVSPITKFTQETIVNMTTIGLDWEDHHSHEVTVGLAAVQINKLEKIVIIRNDFDNKSDRTFRALINPELLKADGEKVYELEGCLSVAGFYGRVRRYSNVRIKALDEKGSVVKLSATGFLARLLQHEIDHINGKTYLDRLDQNGELYRMMPNGKLELLTDEESKSILNELGKYIMAQFIAQPFSNTSELESIIFFGMGPVSLQSLIQLEDSFLIEAIITKPDISKRKDTGNTVSSWAEKNSIPCYQPDSSDSIYELFENNGFVSKVGVVIDYGFIIPEKVIDSFPKGIINSHFSMLPKLRGADPITFALLAGQSSTGVSLMKIRPGLDTGDILASQEVEIASDETNETLTRKLVAASTELLIQTLPSYISGKNTDLQEQDEKQATYSRKLSKSDGEIIWSKSAYTLEREIRAYKPWPGSYTMIDGERVVIDRAHADKYNNKNEKLGSMFIDQDKNLVVVCADNTILVIESLKPAGKGNMKTKAYLAGRQSLVRTLSTLSI